MESIELAGHASRIGVQAISSLPPLGPYSFGEARAYYEAIASASEVPVIVYYYPAISPGVRTLEEIKRLLGIPGVIGVKYTEIDLHGWISGINKTFGLQRDQPHLEVETPPVRKRISRFMQG